MSATYSSLRADGTGVVYGNPYILPLVGGSGAAYYTGFGGTAGGGSGGGALLVAAAETVNLDGAISANGGSGGGSGSGGAVRIVADVIVGGLDGSISCGTAYSAGRIRLEGNQIPYIGKTLPDASLGVPASPDPLIWPPASAPTITIASVNGMPTPSDPRGSFVFPNQDLTVYTTPATTVLLQTTNVPLDWSVALRVVPRAAPDFTVNATWVSGDATAAVWRAQFIAPWGTCALQARASKP